MCLAESRLLAVDHDCKYVEVSAALAHNVDTLLVGITKQIRLKLHTLPRPNRWEGKLATGCNGATHRLHIPQHKYYLASVGSRIHISSAITWRKAIAVWVMLGNSWPPNVIC